MPGVPGPAARCSQQTPARVTNCPRPSTVCVFSSTSLFPSFLAVLLCLWFLIELPGSDTGQWLLHHTQPPQPGHYLTVTRPGFPGGQEAERRPLIGQLPPTLVSNWLRLVSRMWQEKYDEGGSLSDGGRGGPEPRGAENMRWPGDNCDMCPESDMLWHQDNLLTPWWSFVSCHNSLIKRFANR